MYTDNGPIKSGFVFFKSDLCTAEYKRAYPPKYQISRRGGFGFFAKVNPEEVVNGCTIVTSEEYINS